MTSENESYGEKKYFVWGRGNRKIPFSHHSRKSPRWGWHWRNPSKHTLPQLWKISMILFHFHSHLSFQYYSWDKQLDPHSPNNRRPHHFLVSFPPPSPVPIFSESPSWFIGNLGFPFRNTCMLHKTLQFGNIRNKLKLFAYGGLFDLKTKNKNKQHLANLMESLWVDVSS